MNFDFDDVFSFSIILLCIALTLITVNNFW